MLKASEAIMLFFPPETTREQRSDDLSLCYDLQYLCSLWPTISHLNLLMSAEPNLIKLK